MDKLTFHCHYGCAGSYELFLFEDHEGLAQDIIKGDQIWTDGSVIEIYTGCDKDLLDELIQMVDNKSEFKEALNHNGF